MEVALTTENVVAGVPLKETAVAPVNKVPVIVTEVPTPLLVGVKLLMAGAGGALLLLPPPPPPQAAMTSSRMQARQVSMAPARRTDLCNGSELQRMMAPEEVDGGHLPKGLDKLKGDELKVNRTYVPLYLLGAAGADPAQINED
jgi:hypothetical protein